jgi:beta-lactamase class A
MKKLLALVAAIIILGAIVAGGYFAFKAIREGSSTVVSENVNEEERKAKETQERKDQQDLLLEKLKVLFEQKSSGTSYFIAIYDLNNDELFGLDGAKAQHAASVSKVLTAVYTFHLAEESKLKLSDPLGAYNVETQIMFLVNQSSQDSWDLIDDLVGRKSQNAYAKSIGLKSVDLRKGVNKMSPKDATMLLVKLVKGELISEQNRNKLFSYMQNTESEDLFSTGFPKGTIFYHKTGKYLGEAHDSAYVKHERNPFVLTVFSENNTSQGAAGRGKIMSLVALEVYNYFDSL